MFNSIYKFREMIFKRNSDYRLFLRIGYKILLIDFIIFKI